MGKFVCTYKCRRKCAWGNVLVLKKLYGKNYFDLNSEQNISLTAICWQNVI